MSGRPTLQNDDVAAFVASMPASYRDAFDDEAIASHAAIVARRGEASARLETWRELPDGVIAICIVASDRPGLLAQISAALLAHRIDVVAAHAYLRELEERTEAIDILWIRRAPAANGLASKLRPGDVATLAELVSALTSGRATLSDGTVLPRRRRIGNAGTRIRFESDAEAGVTVLTVQAVDRPGLLLSVTRTIFRAGLQIVGLHATTDRGRASDRFEIAEADGSALSQDRLLALQSAILEAVEASVVRVSETTASELDPG